MKHKHIEVGNGKSIDVFDNIFDMKQREHMYMFARNSYFRIGFGDSSSPERKPGDFFLFSNYSQEETNSFGILNWTQNTEISNVLTGLTNTRAVVNLTVPSNVNYIHTHSERKVMLYYVNLEWQEGWHGETQFWSEDNTEVHFTSPYTPGRVIIFDGSIPHCIRPQSSIAVEHRLTIALLHD